MSETNEEEEVVHLEPYPIHHPIHQEDGLWYFWDETWADRLGPFTTEDIAREELHRYGLYLDGKLPGQLTTKDLYIVDE